MTEDIVTPVCFQCKHLYEGELKCAAFPKGIPDDILGGFNFHSKPLPDQDNDIVFDPVEYPPNTASNGDIF